MLLGRAAESSSCYQAFTPSPYRLEPYLHDLKSFSGQKQASSGYYSSRNSVQSPLDRTGFDEGPANNVSDKPIADDSSAFTCLQLENYRWDTCRGTSTNTAEDVQTREHWQADPREHFTSARRRKAFDSLQSYDGAGAKKLTGSVIAGSDGYNIAMSQVLPLSNNYGELNMQQSLVSQPLHSHHAAAARLSHARVSSSSAQSNHSGALNARFSSRGLDLLYSALDSVQTAKGGLQATTTGEDKFLRSWCSLWD